MFQSKIQTDAERLKKLPIAVQDTWHLLIGEADIVFRAFRNLLQRTTIIPKEVFLHSHQFRALIRSLRVRNFKTLVRTMNESPGRDLEVFDFKEEDAIVSDKRLTFKFNKNPILSHHDSLANDAQVNDDCAKNVASFSCVNVGEVGGISSFEKDCPNSSLKSVDDMFDDKGKNSELGASKQSSSSSHENHYHLNTDVDYYDGPEERDTSGGVSTPETSQIGPSGSPSSNESVDVNSEAGVCSNESSPTSATADIAENGVFNFSLNGCGLNGTDNSDLDDKRTEVILRPDYIIYQDNYYTGPKLTFSHCGIKINVSTACMEQGAFDLEWAVDDLIDIKCQLFESSGMVMMKIRVISSNANPLDHVSDTSGVEELEIAVVDSNWPLRHQQITSLNVQYLAIWNIALNTDVEGNETKSRGSRCYFPNFEEPFDEVIYPKGDPDAVSLSKRDFDLLQPDTFINDTIIDFYIQYLKNQIQEEEKPRFYFFNSFFFRKLADMDKNPSSASDAKAAFLRVRKWTRKVKLFEKDYIFIPVNFNLHWSLIVICHPGDVVNFNDKELDKSLKVPCILHMDSIKGSHSGLKNLVQSYLWEEWKERHKDTLEEDLSARFSNMRFIPLALPQQENSYDCGLFLLHYLELFLAEAPLNFNPFKVTRFSKFLNVDWFLPAEAYLKRTLIQRLIFELVGNHGVPEISSSDGSDDHQYTENNENRTAIKHPEVNGGTTTSLAEKGIEITLLSGSSSLDPQSLNNSGLVLKDLFEPGATAGSVLAQCQSFDQRPSDYRFNDSIFTMEEQSDLGEQFMYLATDPNFQQVDGVTPQTSLPYLPGDCGNETCHRPEVSLQVAESSQGNASDDSEDIGVIETCPDGDEPVSSNDAERGEKICSSTENTEHFIDIPGSSSSNLPITSVVGICQDSITNCDGNKNGDIGPPCQEIPTIKSYEVSDAVDDKATCDDDGQMIDGMTRNISEEQAAKRRRLMPLECTSEGIATESDL